MHWLAFPSWILHFYIFIVKQFPVFIQTLTTWKWNESDPKRKWGKTPCSSPFITLPFLGPLPVKCLQPFWNKTVVFCKRHLCLQVMFFNRCLVVSALAGCALMAVLFWPCSLWSCIALSAVLHGWVRCCRSTWQSLLEATPLQDLARKQNRAAMTWKQLLKQKQQLFV